MFFYTNHNEYRNYKEQLDYIICRQSSLHTKSALNFYRQLSIDEGNVVSECSFILVRDNTPLIAFQGAYVKKNGKTKDYPI